MASLARCSSCRGFLPTGIVACPNCGTTEAAGLGSRIGFWLKAAGGASVAMTLMACYGVPVDPNDPTDTDPSEGTGTTTGDTPTTSVSTGGAESTTGGVESSSGGAESSSGGGGSTSAGSTGASDSGGSDGSTGAGGVDEPSLPR